MVKLISPAPNGWRNLDFGATSPRPYSPSRPHQGQDWGWYYSNVYNSRRVVAPASGRVISVTRNGEWNSGWGNRVVIRVTDNITSALNHLETGTVSVREGQWVDAGDYVGQMGATGETYGEPHLHEELYINGVRVDPSYYRTNDLPGTGSSAGGGGTPLPKPNPEPNPEEEDEMKMKGAYYNAATGVVYILFNEVSGFYVEHSGVPNDAYNNAIATNWETNNWVPITESHASVLKQALDKTRTRSK